MKTTIDLTVNSCTLTILTVIILVYLLVQFGFNVERKIINDQIKNKFSEYSEHIEVLRMQVNQLQQETAEYNYGKTESLQNQIDQLKERIK